MYNSRGELLGINATHNSIWVLAYFDPKKNTIFSLLC
jgi:hypothetical protein